MKMSKKKLEKKKLNLCFSI